MIAALAHRGPDGAGIFEADPEIALGHARLAILDLSPAGAQPMTSRDGRWTIVCNGEIFNYRELRGELGAKLCAGPWRSSSDTEVLLEACAAWGIERALDRSIGMFAFALWDARERELTLARDRIGEKPLVYFEEGQHAGVRQRIEGAPGFSWRVSGPSGARSLSGAGLRSGSAGDFPERPQTSGGALAAVERREQPVERWWFPERARPTVSRTPAGRREEARSLIADAVRLRLRSDVPVALALSGGVDSTVIAAEAARQDARHRRLHGNRGRRRDGSAVCAIGRADSTGCGMKCCGRRRASAAQRVFDAAEHFDEPFADSSALSSLELARALAGRYKVILNGDGGDEAFGGYRHYTRIAVKQAVKAAAAGVGLVDGSGATGVYVESKVTFRECGTRILGRRTHGSAFPVAHRGRVPQGFPRRGALKQRFVDRPASVPGQRSHPQDGHGVGSVWDRGKKPVPRSPDSGMDAAASGATIWSAAGRKRFCCGKRMRGSCPTEIAARPKHGFGAPVDAWLAGPLREAGARSVAVPAARSGTANARAGAAAVDAVDLRPLGRALGSEMVSADRLRC